MRSTENWRRYFQFETETISPFSGWRGPHVPDLSSALRLADWHAVLAHILSGQVLNLKMSEPKALILISANKKWNIFSVRWNVSCLWVYISAQTQKYISLFALSPPSFFPRSAWIISCPTTNIALQFVWNFIAAQYTFASTFLTQ